MNERVSRALDGELSREELTTDERIELDAYAGAVREWVSEIRSAHPPDLTHLVMSAIQEMETASFRSTKRGWPEWMGWFWKPRPLLLIWRPAYAAILVLLTASAAVWAAIRPSPLPTLVGEVSPPTSIYVQFRLDAPEATSVQVVGSFTNWSDGIELIETVPGVWSALLPLEPGVHDYTFVVDGDLWVVDPLAPAIDDGFGGSKNRLFLTRPLENV